MHSAKEKIQGVTNLFFKKQTRKQSGRTLAKVLTNLKKKLNRFKSQQ